MYITDKKIKQNVASYIRHRYGVSIESNRIYVFKYDYEWDINRNEYSISKYKECVCDPFPDRIPAKEIDRWGIILSRKDKINKIRSDRNR